MFLQYRSVSFTGRFSSLDFVMNEQPKLIVCILALVFAACSFDSSPPQTAALYEAGLQHLNGHSLWNSCSQQVCFKSTRGGGTECPSVHITEYSLFTLENTRFDVFIK